MSYTPTTWAPGDVITSAKLNKMEQGIASGSSSLICSVSYSSSESTYVLDKTVQEIYDALLEGTPVYIRYQYGTLGASGTGNYVSTVYLAPVIRVYGYNYTNTIRICASKPNGISNMGGKDYLFSPGIVIFSASGLNSYPKYYDSIKVPESYLQGDTGVG